jgi:hypothetical protein
MQSPRDKIASALFTALQALNGTGPNQYEFEHFSRHFRQFDDYNQGDLPAFGLIYLGETQDEPQAFGLREYRMEFIGQFVFQTDPGDSLVGEQIAMNILDSLDKYFPLNGSPNTLGGVCVAAFVHGAVQLDTGVIAQPMVLKVPLTVLAGE